VGWWHANDSMARAQKVFLIVVIAMWIIPVAGITIYAAISSSPSPFEVWSIAFMVTAATYLAGNLLGFLFALPRSAGVGLPKEGLSDVQPNTNLEDVSDWLTKIVVGVTLVELNRLLPALLKLFANVGIALGGQKSATVFAGCIIVYSFAAGLMTAWIATRLFIIQWMAVSDQLRIGNRAAK
jgi:hypothetical protein